MLLPVFICLHIKSACFSVKNLSWLACFQVSPLLLWFNKNAVVPFLLSTCLNPCLSVPLLHNLKKGLHLGPSFVKWHHLTLLNYHQSMCWSIPLQSDHLLYTYSTSVYSYLYLHGSLIWIQLWIYFLYLLNHS